MGREDWYRNQAWNTEIETAFRKQLRRSRSQKPQYLRIQASYLAEGHPQAALQLLEEYFTSGDHVDRAQAFVDRARAYLALGNIELAMASYEAALEREQALPGYQTGAFLDLPLLIAIHGLSPFYVRALQILDTAKDRLVFPLARYIAHGVRAVIAYARGERAVAEMNARLALKAASQRRSGFHQHPDIGLVQGTTDEFGRRLKAIAQPQQH